MTSCKLQESGIKIRLDKIFWQHVMACLDSFSESSLIPSLDSLPPVCLGLPRAPVSAVYRSVYVRIIVVMQEERHIYKTRRDIYCKMEISLRCLLSHKGQKCLRMPGKLCRWNSSWIHTSDASTCTLCTHSEWMGRRLPHHTYLYPQRIRRPGAVMETQRWWSLWWKHPFRQLIYPITASNCRSVWDNLT